nr:unnamed protein product [Callosobruchus analis]
MSDISYVVDIIATQHISDVPNTFKFCYISDNFKLNRSSYMIKTYVFLFVLALASVALAAPRAFALPDPVAAPNPSPVAGPSPQFYYAYPYYYGAYII